MSTNVGPMIGHVANVAVPKMTKPWNVVAAAMAVFGFVYGYVGTAGAPFCGSLGQCVQRVVDAGPPWFYPASLIPGVIAAAVFAAFVYLLFLLVHGIRVAFRRPPVAPMGPGSRVERQLRTEPPAAQVIPEPTSAERRRELPAVQAGPRRRSRPTPMVIAIGAALGWAVLSVGPATLASDLDQVIPRDTVTTAVCGEGQPVHEDGLCSSLQQYVPPAWCPGVGIHWECIGPAQPQFVLTKPGCAASGLQGLIGPSQSPEADGKCHERSGGTVEPLMDDVVHGGQSGLLAFLAVGAALLLSPKLRAASQPQG